MHLRLFIYLAAIILLCACGHAGPAEKTAKDDLGLSGALLDFYRGPLNHLKAVRHGECPMHPSCSEYCRQAIQTYGPIQGWIMTCDRLMRCGRDETRIAPRILVNGRLKYYDPPANNAGPIPTSYPKGE